MKTLFTLILCVGVVIASVTYTACGGVKSKEVVLEAARVVLDPEEKGVLLVLGVDGGPGVAVFHTAPTGPTPAMVKELRETVVLNPGIRLVTCHSATLPKDLQRHLLLSPSHKRVVGKVLAFDRVRQRIKARFWLE